MLYLDGTLSSSLNWKKEIDEAEKRDSITWYLGLGLFSNLEDESHFLSLKLSIQHFNETIWSRFAEKTEAICLYQGPLDFGITDDPYESRDMGAEYLEMLAAYLPDDLKVTIHCTTEGITDPLERALLSTKERFPNIQVTLDEESVENVSLGVCIPSVDRNDSEIYTEIREALESLEEKKTPYRVIPEPMIITEWHGLDTLLVLPNTLTQNGKRQIQGFLAAGGAVLDLGTNVASF